jgi:DNA-binding NarL/FixJ family response regulator
MRDVRDIDAEPIRILLADDHASFRGGLVALLGTVPGIEVAGEATTGEEAVAQALGLQPDLVVMDLNMPGMDGIEATRRIVATSPHIAVLVLSMYEDDDQVFGALKAGARGYVLKGADRAELVRAIRSVSSGEAIFGPGVARRLMSYFAARPAVAAAIFPELTDREREILDMVARGLSNSEITQRLVLSPKTVRNHVSNIFSKLQVADRAQAIVLAREAGLGGERPTGHQERPAPPRLGAASDGPDAPDRSSRPAS